MGTEDEVVKRQETTKQTSVCWNGCGDADEWSVCRPRYMKAEEAEEGRSVESQQLTRKEKMDDNNARRCTHVMYSGRKYTENSTRDRCRCNSPAQSQKGMPMGCDVLPA